VKPPTRDPCDSLVAFGAKSACSCRESEEYEYPETFRHMISFAFLEVSFIDGIVWIGFAFDLNVSFNGRATGRQQPHLIRVPSSSHVSPKKFQSRPRYRSKYFDLSQLGFLFWCLLRAHRHRQ